MTKKRPSARVPKFPARLREFAQLGPGVCWMWPGRLTAKGYGQVGGRTARAQNGETLSSLAHKRAYQLLVGPVPDGLELDHTCRNKPCFNPAHLEPVTSLVNTRRALPFRERRDTCKHGHPYPPDAKIEKGGRVCPECKRIEAKRRRDADPEACRAYNREWKRANYWANRAEFRGKQNEYARRKYAEARGHAFSR